MSVWCLDLLVGCLDLSFGCLDLSFGCLDLSFGCLDLSFGCMDLSFACLDLSFGCLDLSSWCLDLSFGCLDASFIFFHDFLAGGETTLAADLITASKTFGEAVLAAGLIATQYSKWRLPAPNLHFLIFFRVWGTVIGLKLTRLACCAGLRRESVIFPDIQNVEALSFSFSGHPER